MSASHVDPGRILVAAISFCVTFRSTCWDTRETGSNARRVWSTRKISRCREFSGWRSADWKLQQSACPLLKQLNCLNLPSNKCRSFTSCLTWMYGMIRLQEICWIKLIWEASENFASCFPNFQQNPTNICIKLVSRCRNITPLPEGRDPDQYWVFFV